MEEVRAVFISDLHIKSENFQARRFLETMANYRYEQLFLVGDAIEDDHTPLDEVKINWHQFQVVGYFRRQLRKKSGNVVFRRIKGNHDPSGDDLLNEILGTKSLSKYVWRMDGKVFCVIHGHQFDKFLFQNSILSKIVSTLFLYLQKIDTRKRHFTRWIDRCHNRWFRMANRVANGAIKFAEKRNIDVIICGHTHQSDHRVFTRVDGREIHYWNCGDWTGHTCSFITMQKDGEMQVHVIEEPQMVA